MLYHSNDFLEVAFNNLLHYHCRRCLFDEKRGMSSIEASWFGMNVFLALKNLFNLLLFFLWSVFGLENFHEFV
jgi:hypothetical protein